MSQRKSKSKAVDAAISPPKVYYPFLDGFRAIAIIMILVHHIRRAFTLDYLFVSNPPILKWVYFKAYEVLGINLTAFYKVIQYMISQLKGVMGVEIFFVLSGFLITGMLLRKEIHSGNVVHFYQRRFLRIYPCYCLMVLVSMAIYVWQGHEGIASGIVIAVYHLLFLQNYFPLNPLLAHTWTLVVLEQFYFFCPLVILAVNGLTGQVSLRRRILTGVCFVLMLMASLIRGHILSTGQSVFSWPLNSTTPYWTISANLGPICFGSLLALWEPYWSQWKKSKIAGWMLWFAGIGIFLYLFFDVDWSYYWGSKYFFTSGYLDVGLLFFAAYQGVSFLARLKTLQWVGKCSYGIFAWHYLVLEFWKLWIGTIPPELIILCALGTSIWAGVLSTNTIERYFLSMRDRIVPNI